MELKWTLEIKMLNLYFEAWDVKLEAWDVHCIHHGIVVGVTGVLHIEGATLGASFFSPGCWIFQLILYWYCVHSADFMSVEFILKLLKFTWENRDNFWKPVCVCFNVLQCTDSDSPVIQCGVYHCDVGFSWFCFTMEWAVLLIREYHTHKALVPWIVTPFQNQFVTYLYTVTVNSAYKVEVAFSNWSRIIVPSRKSISSPLF